MNAKTVLYSIYDEALTEIQKRASQDRSIEIFDLGGYAGRPIRLGVNWAGIGTVPPDKAQEFSRQIMEAAALAENFEYNGFTIVWD